MPKTTPNTETVDFTGSFTHGIDNSRRVMLPAKWRSKTAVKFTILPWPIGKNDRLLVLPPERWGEMLAKLKVGSLSDKKVEVVERVIAGSAAQVELDKVGRLCLPENLTRTVGIKNEARLVGRLDKFEIWEPEAGKAEDENNLELAARLAEQMNL